MTAKEKAQELIEKFSHYAHCDTDRNVDYNEQQRQLKNNSRQCALIFVDEILNGSMIWNSIEGSRRVFWQQVKEEIAFL